jgi:OmpA-OmpF porin, OOP family
MHQPRKWWIGLPVLAGLSYLAAESLTPRIESDLRARTAARLSIESGKLSVSGRDVVLPADVATPEKIAAMRAEFGLRKLSMKAPASPADATAVSAPAPAPAATSEPSAPLPHKSYVFSAVLRESVVALDGALPSEDLRKRAVALAAAAGAGRAVSDGTKIDAAAPPGDYAGAVGVALDALRHLAVGRVSLDDAKLSIEGEGLENVRAETLSQEVKAKLPQGFDLAAARIAPGPVAPYVFAAAREGGRTIVTGFVPDEAARDHILEGARRRFFDSMVEDRLGVAKGAPEKFMPAVDTALAALARLHSGALSMTGVDVSLSGAARYEGVRAEIAKALEVRLPNGFKVDARLTAHALEPPLDAAGCRAAFAELSKTQLRFEPDNSAISEESLALLDAMTVAALRCKTAPIEIAGYDDRQGDADAGRERSKRRAQLVVDAFLKAGADSFHVWARGYGGERPNADNSARGREIEFNVK